MGTSAPQSTPQGGARVAGAAGATVAARTAGAGAAGAAQGGAGAAGGAAKLAAASVLTSLVAFLAALRQRQQAWLARELGGYARDPNDVAAALHTEAVLSEVFARNSADRVARALPAALAISDRAQRDAAVRRILADEERFARQHTEAAAARAIAAVRRSGLRRESPLGAFWRLGVAHKHTEGCLRMAGKFWPWAVLDRVHPPRHYGCSSSLHSFGEALQAGWISARDVPDVRDAISRAAGVMMEGEADALLAEVDVRERLQEVGVDTSTIPFAGVLYEEAKDGG